MRSLTLALALAAPLSAGALPTGRAAEDRGTPSGGIEWLGGPPKGVPRRLVSLAPSATDVVVALGCADRLVGVTRYDTAPEVARAARVGGFLDPSAEAILALRPDAILWIADTGATPAVRRLAELGIPVLALPVFDVADVLAATRAIGAALGAAEAGERLAKELEAAIARARVRTAGLPQRRVLFLVGRAPLVAAGPGSYPDELLGILGARNVVAGRRAWPVVPLETAAALDPEVVVDAAVREHGGPGGSLLAIPAVRRGAVVRMSDDAALRPGPRLVQALEELLPAIHPGLR
jgi:iron complex transport system substrate-binding protein